MAAAAKKHIETIRRNKGLLDGDTLGDNVLDLERALVILSEQLYSSSTHFLLELIQNADDNSYSNLIPTLNITYEKRGLRVDCNEKGFEAKHVNGICSIGQGTKGNDPTNYIGEKGIGFKSVFKVADVIWISSGAYSFKLDKRERLGMIAPIWAEFPFKVLPGQTSFYLQLSVDYKEGELIQELRSFDSRMLIFLRKLRHVNITVTQKNQIVWKNSLKRTDEQIDNDKITTLQQNEKLTRYVVYRSTVNNLPSEPKRVGCSKSEIVMAFPIPYQEAKPEWKSQQVYSFLPIRDFGFTFLLQGDFMLSASREDIDNSSPWNHALRLASAYAFVTAINNFNSGPRRYEWFRYLPFSNIPDFFTPLRKSIMESLAALPILESRTGSMARPSSLSWVPKEYADDQGVPFTLNTSTESMYLSKNYPPQTWILTRDIGAKELTMSKFLQDLELTIQNHAHDFQTRPDSWHSQLSKALLLCSASNSHASSLAKLSIIPLRDGSWVSAEGRIIFFYQPTSNLEVPKDIEVLITRPLPKTDIYRRKLLELLGVTTYWDSKICDIITAKHADLRFNAQDSNPTELISHVVYLYKAHWFSPLSTSWNQNGLWFVTDRGGRCLGSKLYMDDADTDVRFSATKYFGDRRATYPFLHPAYLDAIPGEEKEFRRWLVKNLNLSTLPRLVSPLVGLSFDLSDDFKQIFREFASPDFLLLLCHNWGHYSEWIMERSESEANSARAKIRGHLASTAVRCGNGVTRPLNQTFLPWDDPALDGKATLQSESATDIRSHLSILDIPQPGNEIWQCLGSLGVAVRKDSHLYLSCLERLQGLEVPLRQISYIYEQLQATCGKNEQLIRNTFNGKNLIYIPPSSDGAHMRWVQAQECVWEGPEFLKEISCLKAYYPTSQRLFCDMLGIKNADIDALVADARKIQTTRSLENISKLFHEISERLEKDSSTEAERTVTSLRSNCVFPIRKNERDSGFFELSTGDDLTTWFIADRQHLLSSFNGIAPLLAFSVFDIMKMTKLFQILTFEKRMLSNAAKSEPIISGNTIPHGSYSTRLQSKARFITRLALSSNPNSEWKRPLDLLKVLGQVEVVETSSIQQQLVLDCGIKGRPEKGEVVLQPTDSSLRIYMLSDGITGCPPYQLTGELARFSGIEDKHKILLQHVLFQHDLSKIEQLFQKEGIFSDESLQETENASSGLPTPPETPLVSTPRGATGSEGLPLGLSVSNSLAISAVVPVERNPFTHVEVKQESYKFSLPPQAIKIQERHGKDSDFNSMNRNKSDTAQPKHRTFGHKARPRKNEDLKAALDNTHSSGINNVSKSNMSSLQLSSQKYLSKQSMKSAPPSSVSNDSMPIKGNRDMRSKPDSLNHRFPKDTSLNFHRQGDRSNVRDSNTPKVDGPDHVAFLGEHMISKIFERHIGEKYSPEKHWTSKMRRRAGYAPFVEGDNEHSSFTLHDCGSEFLIQHQYNKASRWRKNPPVYHFQVKTTVGGIESDFDLKAAEFNMARNFTFVGSSGGMPREVVILIRVCNIHKDPDIRFYVDPWNLFYTNDLQLGNVGFLNASMSDEPSHISSPSLATINKSELSYDYTAQTAKLEVRQLKYTYTQLSPHGEIRLLSLSPGEGQTSLRGEIYHTSLGSATKYKALSYVWGAPDARHHLRTSQGIIPLKKSLHSALLRLRKKQELLVLWVDAISINQDDNNEKKQQISLMPRIYNEAVQVIAYVGEEADQSRLALETLMQVTTKAANLKEWPSSIQPVPLSWDERCIPPAGDDVWKAIRALFSRPYFRRVWIIQEIVVAEDIKVACGKSFISWDDLVNAVEVCEREMSIHSMEYGSLEGIFEKFRRVAMQREWDIQGYRWGLLELLQSFGYAEATQQHDHLFALVGLAYDEDDPGFDISYEISFEEIIQRYAHAFINQGRTMQLLYRAALGSQPATCPSWIPDWTTQNSNSLYSWSSRGGYYCASGETQVQTYHDARKDELIIRGRLFDSIKFVSKSTNEPEFLKSYLFEVAAMIDWLGEYPTGEDLYNLKWMVPVAGAELPLVVNAGLPDLKSSYTILIDFLGNRSSDDEKMPKQCQDYVGTLQGKTREFTLLGWKCFITRKGYVGVAPKSILAGDLVCIFNGGAVPFLLRNSETRNGAYRLVGGCYIHGMMRGRAMRGDAQEEKIRLH